MILWEERKHCPSDGKTRTGTGLTAPVLFRSFHAITWQWWVKQPLQPSYHPEGGEGGFTHMRKCQMLVKNRGDNEGKGEKGKGKHPLVARVSYRRENPVEVGSGK